MVEDLLSYQHVKMPSGPDNLTSSPKPSPFVIVIAALARENRCIGHNTRIPWHVPEDLKRFKRLTYGFPIIMGRITCEGLVRDFGGPLPGRRMLMLTRTWNKKFHPDIELHSSLASALECVKTVDQVFLAGGTKIYEEGLKFADRLELTLINGSYDGDTFFPVYDHLIGTEFSLSREEVHDGFSFVTYDRIRNR